MRAMLLCLFIVLWSSPSWSLPGPCSSTKFDDSIGSAVDQYWRDFPDAKWWKAQLCQESQLNPNAVSPVGAQGLAQIMPQTYAEIIRSLHWDARTTAFDPDRAIQAGAFYQGNVRRFWSPEGRLPVDRHQLGLAGYNAGNGNIVKAQALCDDARLWANISPCLERVTGPNATETLTYVSRITKMREQP